MVNRLIRVVPGIMCSCCAVFKCSGICTSGGMLFTKSALQCSICASSNSVGSSGVQ